MAQSEADAASRVAYTSGLRVAERGCEFVCGGAALHRSGLTHDALDHHRRDARKHGLGHRRRQDVGDRA